MLEDTCLGWMHLWCQDCARHGGLLDEAKVDVPSHVRRRVRRDHGCHHVGGDGDLVLHHHRSKCGDGVLMDSVMMLVSVAGSVGNGAWRWMLTAAFTSARPASPPRQPRYLDAVKNITSLSAAMLRSSSALLVYWRVVVVAW